MSMPHSDTCRCPDCMDLDGIAELATLRLQIVGLENQVEGAELAEQRALTELATLRAENQRVTGLARATADAADKLRIKCVALRAENERLRSGQTTDALRAVRADELTRVQGKLSVAESRLAEVVALLELGLQPPVAAPEECTEADPDLIDFGTPVRVPGRFCSEAELARRYAEK